MLQVVPAIDLMNGRVVRLRQGQEKKQIKYSDDPLSVARNFELEGASLIHVIDLDAAFGRTPNTPMIRRIHDAVSVPLEVGGGIRNPRVADKLFSMGIEQLIIGSILFTDEKMTDKILQEYGCERVIAAVDYENTYIKTHGWTRSTGYTIQDALDMLAHRGYKWILATDTRRDGTLSGPDVKTLAEISRRPNIKIIAAGGIGRLADIRSLMATNVARVVIGKALYEKAFSLSDALGIVRKQR
ncbi:MAG: 1-(5-phosphoribosyl)-5-[(5-phosphoribosylamino)methylideneamino]imidazole-4-carboxamide isomerase [Candidatus Ranarchaeia archaeon]